MKKYYCYGKADICEARICNDCKYYDGSGGEEIELTPEQEKAYKQLKNQEEAAAAWEAFIKQIKDTLNKFLKNFVFPLCEMLLGFAGLFVVGAFLLILILSFPLWAIPYIIFKLKNKEGQK